MTLKMFGYGFSPVLGAVCASLCFAALPAHAANCDDPQTQVEINDCSQALYEKADKELNVVYKKALENLKAKNPERIEAFVNIQRSWIKFRDLNCQYAAIIYNGSMGPTVRDRCLKTLSEERTKQIPKLFFYQLQ